VPEDAGGGDAVDVVVAVDDDRAARAGGGGEATGGGDGVGQRVGRMERTELGREEAADIGGGRDAAVQQELREQGCDAGVVRQSVALGMRRGDDPVAFAGR
jgi:hypothetical protein